MATVRINWTAYASAPGDVDSVDIYRSLTLTSESAFQTALDDGSLTAVNAIQSISDVVNTSNYDDTTAETGNTYYYCLAARNSGGSTVGARGTGDTQAPTVVPAAGNTAGAVACVSV